MASETEASCESDPNFAVICAFLEKFGVTCGISGIDFFDLQTMLEDTQEVAPALIDMHVKLIRKTKKSVTFEKWEKILIKLCHTFCSQDAWEVERFGYKNAKLSSKIRILKELLEMQFDCNNKFKTEVNKMTADELRSQPLGRDKIGNTYWFMNDENYQIRVYKEDLDDQTWKLVAKDKESLLTLIGELNGEPVKPKAADAAIEDSNSLSEKPLMDTGQSEKPSEENENSTDSKNDDSLNEKPKKQNISENSEKTEGVDASKDDEAVKLKIPKLRIKALSEIVNNNDKRNFESSDEDDSQSAKKAKLEDVKNASSEDTEVSGVIEEPVMVIRGEGSGADNDAENPIVGEEIEEEIVYFFGEGYGAENTTGNDNKPEDSDIKSGQSGGSVLSDSRTIKNSDDMNFRNSINESEVIDNKMEDPTSPVKSSFKLGTVLDTKTDSKIPGKCPVKRSRWDVAASVGDDETDDIEGSMDMDSALESDMVDSEKMGNVKNLINKWENIGSSDSGDAHENSCSETNDTAEQSDGVAKNGTFFFGPGSSPFKTNNVSLEFGNNVGDTTEGADGASLNIDTAINSNIAEEKPENVDIKSNKNQENNEGQTTDNSSGNKEPCIDSSTSQSEDVDTPDNLKVPEDLNQFEKNVAGTGKNSFKNEDEENLADVISTTNDYTNGGVDITDQLSTSKDESKIESGVSDIQEDIEDASENNDDNSDDLLDENSAKNGESQSTNNLADIPCDSSTEIQSGIEKDTPTDYLVEEPGEKDLGDEASGECNTGVPISEILDEQDDLPCEDEPVDIAKELDELETKCDDTEVTSSADVLKESFTDDIALEEDNETESNQESDLVMEDTLIGSNIPQDEDNRDIEKALNIDSTENEDGEVSEDNVGNLDDVLDTNIDLPVSQSLDLPVVNDIPANGEVSAIDNILAVADSAIEDTAASIDSAPADPGSDAKDGKQSVEQTDIATSSASGEESITKDDPEDDNIADAEDNVADSLPVAGDSEEVSSLIVEVDGRLPSIDDNLESLECDSSDQQQIDDLDEKPEIDDEPISSELTNDENLPNEGNSEAEENNVCKETESSESVENNDNAVTESVSADMENEDEELAGKNSLEDISSTDDKDDKSGANSSTTLIAEVENSEPGKDDKVEDTHKLEESRAEDNVSEEAGESADKAIDDEATPASKNPAAGEPLDDNTPPDAGSKPESSDENVTQHKEPLDVDQQTKADLQENKCDTTEVDRYQKSEESNVPESDVDDAEPSQPDDISDLGDVESLKANEEGTVVSESKDKSETENTETKECVTEGPGASEANISSNDELKDNMGEHKEKANADEEKVNDIEKISEDKEKEIHEAEPVSSTETKETEAQPALEKAGESVTEHPAEETSEASTEGSSNEKVEANLTEKNAIVGEKPESGTTEEKVDKEAEKAAIPTEKSQEQIEGKTDVDKTEDNDQIVEEKQVDIQDKTEADNVKNDKSQSEEQAKEEADDQKADSDDPQKQSKKRSRPKRGEAATVQNNDSVPETATENVEEKVEVQEKGRRSTRRSGHGSRVADVSPAPKKAQKGKKTTPKTENSNKLADSGKETAEPGEEFEPQAKKYKTTKKAESNKDEIESQVAAESKDAEEKTEGDNVETETRVTRRSGRFSGPTVDIKPAAKKSKTASEDTNKKTKQQKNEPKSDSDATKKGAAKKSDIRKRGRSQEGVKSESEENKSEESRTLRGGRKSTVIASKKIEVKSEGLDVAKKVKLTDEASETKKTRATRSGKPVVEPVEVASKAKAITPKKGKNVASNAAPKNVPTRGSRSLRGSTGSNTPASSPNVPVVDCDTNLDSGSDVVEVQEQDPLAVSESEPELPKAKPTLQSLSFDFNEPPPSTASTRRSLRKRGLESPENFSSLEEANTKKAKLKGKRSVDTQLRKSIEEKKKQQLSSSEDDVIVISDSSSQEALKKKTPAKKGKKSKSPQKKKPEPVSSGTDVASSENPQPSKRQKVLQTRNNRILLNLGVKPDEAESILKDDGLNVRQSRRIAQIKIREEAEERKIEEEERTSVEVEPKSSKKHKKPKVVEENEKVEKRKRNKPDSGSDDVIYVQTIEDKKKKKKKKKTDIRKLFDESHPWRSSSDETSDDNGEEEDYVHDYSEPEEEPLQFKSDHEFSPESDVENTEEWKPTKRARTARKDSEEEPDDFPCKKCGKSDNPEFILLCDKCDSGWHCSCLRPSLSVIPEGDWYCPPCQHIRLLESLQLKLEEYEKKLVKKELEDRRKERLAYVGISLNNVLKKGSKKKHSDDYDEDEADSELESSSSSSSDSDEPIYQLRQRRQAHSYKFNDYDDLINSAIQDEVAAKGAGNLGRGKDIATIVNANAEKEKEEKKLDEVVDEGPEPLPPVVPKSDVSKEIEPAETDGKKSLRKRFGRKKHRKLNSLDDDSEDDVYSDEDFKGSSSEADEDVDEEESDSEDEDVVPVRRSGRNRIARYDADFVNDNSSSEDGRRKKKKRREKWDDTESEESDDNWGGKKGRRKQIRSHYRPLPKKKKSKKKKKKHRGDSDLEAYKTKRKPKIKYGGLTSDDEDTGRRTRGRKTNYTAILGSESEEEEGKKTKTRKSDSDEYVENDDEEKISEDEDEDSHDENGKENSSDEEVRRVPKLKVKVRRIIESDDEDSNAKPEPAKEEQEPVPVPEKKPEPIVDDDKDTSKDESDTELNTSDELPKNLDEMDEAEIEKMMEDEEYANRQLQLVAIQIEKKKRKEEKARKKSQETQNQVVSDTPKATVIPEKVPVNEEPSSPIKDQIIESRPPDKDILNQLTVPSEVAITKTPVNIVEPETSQKPFEVPSRIGDTLVIRTPNKVRIKNTFIEKIPLQPTQIMKLTRNLVAKDRSNLPKTDIDVISKRDSIVGNTEDLIVNSVEKDQLSEPPEATLPIFLESSSTPIKEQTQRKSRSKKSIRDALANLEVVRNQSRKPPVTVSKQDNIPSNLEVAAPPQPFSQSQPTPSVITRMLQSEPATSKPTTYPIGTIRPKQFAMLTEREPDEPAPMERQTSIPPMSSTSPHVPPHFMTSGGRVLQSQSPYQQMPIGNYSRGGPGQPLPPSHTMHSAPPPGIPPHLYQPRRTMDPSPSGGSPVKISTAPPVMSPNVPLNMSSSNLSMMTDRNSPRLVSPASISPASKSDGTPPPSYVRQPPPRMPQNIPPPQRPMQPIPPHLLPPRNVPQYSVPQNYHYGNYPPPPQPSQPAQLPTSEDAMQPTVYQNSPYSEQQYIGDAGAMNNPSDNSNSNKGYDEELSGEFGGLVSYFSSQREDDLDS